jgi:hypothetical protein
MSVDAAKLAGFDRHFASDKRSDGAVSAGRLPFNFTDRMDQRDRALGRRS